ncbi:MAG: flagellar biosynthesis protein FlgB [Nocardioidaceae bacterium]|nr:flagellar biosynthesis protein FlgB [Nocardioidaceae bacterium]NUS50561.1 flagellar biosynthesis protein FlgB [Nocardioidaceae bacterium]
MSISASDPVGATLHAALDGLAYRQRVAADDIANVDTPNYTGHRVEFEDSLRSAVVNGTVGEGVTPQLLDDERQAGANGNNVDLASETMTAMQATFSYQLLSRAVGDRYGLITTAIGGM